MSQKGEGPHSDDKEWLKSWKISHNFSYISEFQKTYQSCDKMLREGNFECQFEIWMSYKGFYCQCEGLQ